MCTCNCQLNDLAQYCQFFFANFRSRLVDFTTRLHCSVKYRQYSLALFCFFVNQKFKKFVEIGKDLGAINYFINEIKLKSNNDGLTNYNEVLYLRFLVPKVIMLQ
jgi:hypothetical protein